MIPLVFSTAFYLPRSSFPICWFTLSSISVSHRDLADKLRSPCYPMAAFSNTVANHVVYKSGHQASILVCSVHSAQGLMLTLNETSPIGRIVGYSLIWGFGFGCICAPTSLQVKLIAPMFVITRARKSRRSSHRSPSG